MSTVSTRNFTMVTFYFPGNLFAEESSRETEENPLVIAKNAPEGAFCFTLQDMVEKKVTVDGETFEKLEPVGERSGYYYLGGKLHTVEELKAKAEKDPSLHVLVCNIEGNGHHEAIQCRTGNWRPFTKTDTLLIEFTG